jgi:FkbM family methyltransferase
LRAAYDAIPNADTRPVVLFGSGALGQRTAAALGRAARLPVAFADNNKDKWGTTIDGLPILSPQSAAKLYGATAIFVITIYNGAAVRAQVGELGCANILHFSEYYHGLPDILLPWCDLDTPQEIFAAQTEITETACLWADDFSRAEFAGQLAWRLGLSFPSLPPHDRPQDCYFPKELITFGADTHVVDCGAFDGDSLRLLLARAPQIGSFLGLEPDPENYAKLQQYLETLPAALLAKIAARQCAVAAETGTLHFNASGSVASGIASFGETDVQTITLDELLADRPVNFIKMDIEGAELEALSGARNTLRNKKPCLALSAYHKPSDLWNIPRLIKSIVPEYDLYLRRYAEDCWELVCYAVPPSWHGSERGK